MKIAKVVCAPGRTGFYFDDQKAIKQGAKMDGFFYDGAPETSGFTAIRQAGESISLMLVLEDGSIAWGDCAEKHYSGAGGGDPSSLAEDFHPVIMRDIAPKLEGIQEGSCTARDNPMLMYCSSMMTGGHDASQLPVVVLGGAGGRLKGGRVLDYKEKSERQMCRLYLSMMDKMSVRPTTFGDAVEALNEV